MVRLLEELPDLDDLPWHRIRTLARLHDLHHHILVVLADLATCGGENIEQGWLETFGDLLDPDETALLARAATTEQRLSHLFSWRDRTEPELDADETEIEGDDDANDAEPAPTPPQLLAALADTYRRTVLDYGRQRPGYRRAGQHLAARPSPGQRLRPWAGVRLVRGQGGRPGRRADHHCVLQAR